MMTRPALIVAGILMAMTALSQDAGIADGPFASIVARNMFSLVPIPPEAPSVVDPVDPPPKITPTGIMTIFGRDQALFKASNMARPGQPSKEEAYVLSEGERQDDIEVVKIDHLDGVITFNNHGTIQELPLVPVKDSGGRSSSASGGRSALPFATIPRPGNYARSGMVGGNVPGTFNPANSFANGVGNRSGIGNPTGLANTPNPNNVAAGKGSIDLASFGGTQAGATHANQPESDQNLTPEQSVILIEAQRMKWLQENNPAHMILPPTPLTQQVLDENGPQAP